MGMGRRAPAVQALRELVRVRHDRDDVAAERPARRADLLRRVRRDQEVVHLHREGRLHADVRILALARSSHSREAYQALAERHCRAQVARADFDRGPHHPYYELLAASVPEMRQGWLDEREAAMSAHAVAA